MFSMFKRVPDTREAALRDLTEDQLSEVAGGKAHHHHTHHHHHVQRKMPQGMTGMTGTTTTTVATTTPGVTVVEGVTYPNNAHW